MNIFPPRNPLFLLAAFYYLPCSNRTITPSSLSTLELQLLLCGDSKLQICNVTEGGKTRVTRTAPWGVCTAEVRVYRLRLFHTRGPLRAGEHLQICQEGSNTLQIGVILRDSHGIAQVKSVTGSKILRILKAHGLAPEIPEDLYHLIKKAVSIRKHLERNRKDKDSKFRLILVESRIHRLARYYKKTKKLPPVWKYESTTASTLVAKGLHDHELGDKFEQDNQIANN
ncbi:ribosomal protein S13A [Prunus dulcis]|uniref:Ribosomal protein S13A n=1 Tax=Prunus dulcis TaxID=3755 RepID=A0A4Y1RE89_PRUDU|nr:ribosomal protein S13A [Prunus dulcis]